MWNIPSERSVQVCRVQEGGLPLRSLWILMFLLPRKTHAIFLVFDEKFNWEQTSFLKERGE